MRPGFDITAGLPLDVVKVTGKKVLPLSLHMRMVRLSFFYGFYRRIIGLKHKQLSDFP